VISHISIVPVFVSDQDRALEFYTAALGFEVRVDYPTGEMRWLEVAPPGAQTRIVLTQASQEWGAEKIGQFTGLGLEADDVEATWRELAARGVTFTEEPNRQPWGIQAQFVDQDGNGFVLGERQ